MMTTNALRKRFLDFFKAKGHKIISSDSLVPKNDPSVLFTSAGMNQFKEQFLGKVTDYRRSATSQKCLRTADLENVGRTPSHHTFFEMLGNFSFGDYFKKEAISWAWEFLTHDLKIDSDRLWVSVYEDDAQAYDIWLNEVKIPKERIYKFGEKENFWPANAIKEGPNGPCGPCSEIFFDWGKDAGCGRAQCSPRCDCGRFVEIWNLVFTQFNRRDNAKLEPLPSKNIDTGMGLERMSSCVQGVKTNFQIDIFKPLIDEIRKILDIKPNVSNEKVNCIADHTRAAVFAIADGVLPSNEGRGYVIRKLIRRASWLTQELDFKKPFLYKLVSRVCDLMKEPYPELMERRENISSIILSEEERFMNNIKEGSGFLKEIIADHKNKNMDKISGETIFKLYDTFGFPLELTEIFAKESGIGLDLVGFNEEMSKQRQKAKAGSNIASDIFSKDILEILPTEFVGYELESASSQIIQIIKSKQSIDCMKEGEDGWIVLDKTPFYGESGGQTGDTGRIFSQDEKFSLDVLDAKQIDSKIIVLIVKVKKGEFRLGDKVTAQIDFQRRQAIRRAHTATHLLQAVLRRVLGEHVQQSGSLVEPDHLRFDFTHFKDINDEELNKIQDLINENIRANDEVNVEIVDKNKALKSGAIALFGEKYGESVRVISIADYSKEFCGGTHLNFTGNIGVAVINSESSIGSGLRRIDAYTGKLAHEKLKNSFNKLKSISTLLNTQPENVLDAVETAIEKNKKLEKDIAHLTKENLRFQIPEIIDNSKHTIEGVNFVVHQFKDLDMSSLRSTSDLFMDELQKHSVIFLATSTGLCITRVSKDMKDTINAPKIQSEIIEPFGGSGGGRPDFAQGGIKDVKKINAVLSKAKEVIKKTLSK